MDKNLTELELEFISLLKPHPFAETSYHYMFRHYFRFEDAIKVHPERENISNSLKLKGYLSEAIVNGVYENRFVTLTDKGISLVKLLESE